MLDIKSWIVIDIVLILFSLTMIRLYIYDKKMPQKIKNKREER